MTSSKPRPNHPVGCNGYYCTMFSAIRFSGRPTATSVPTSLFRAMALIVQRSAPYKSPDAQQQTTSGSLCYLQRSIPYNDQYHRIYLPTPNGDRRPDHSVGCNGPYRTTISTAQIGRRQTTNHVPITLLPTTVNTVPVSYTHLTLPTTPYV